MKPGEEIKKKLIEETESRPKKGGGGRVGGWLVVEGRENIISFAFFIF